MERKKFLLTTAAAIPALLIGENVKAQNQKDQIKALL